MNRIELFRSRGSWCARYVGPHAAAIRDLFGCTVLPTAWEASAAAAQVCANVQRMNPDALVSVGAE